MKTDWIGFYACKGCHKTESLWNHTTTDHKEGEQLEDRRNVGESSCNSGDGTDQRVQYLMFIMIFVHLFFFLLALQPTVGLYFAALYGGYSLLAYEVSISHTTTPHSPYDSSGRVISPSQRPLPDNTQHSQQTNIHAPGGIRTHDPSRRAAVDLRLRPRGYWVRRPSILHSKKVKVYLSHCWITGLLNSLEGSFVAEYIIL